MDVEIPTRIEAHLIGILELQPNQNKIGIQ